MKLFGAKEGNGESAELSLKIGMRKLWADHVIWTRGYIVEVLKDAPDTGQAASRLLRNQDDLGNALVPYYGKEGGAKLTELLKQHIMIAVDLVAAAKSGDQSKFTVYDQKWTQNANDLAGFLSSANPNWTKEDLIDLLGQHLTLTKNEVVARLSQKWDVDIQTFDDIFTEINTVADTLSAGIIKQFPDRFGR